MELFVNDTLVGVTPKENDTIQNLLDAVSKELDQDLIIAALMIDGNYRSVDDPAVLSMPVNQVQKVEMTVATKMEIGISLIEEGKYFLDIGAQELKNGSLAKRTELINSFAWILDSLEALKNALAFPPTDIPILKAIITDILKKIDDNNVSLEETKQIGEQLEKLVDLFEVLKHKLINNEYFSKDDTFILLGNIQKTLPDIATNFQTGNDLQAIQELCRIIDTIEIFVRFAATVPEDNEIEQHALALKDISFQMLQAFENKDFVLIADIIEYDLSDQIDIIINN